MIRHLLLTTALMFSISIQLFSQAQAALKFVSLLNEDLNNTMCPDRKDMGEVLSISPYAITNDTLSVSFTFVTADKSRKEIGYRVNIRSITSFLPDARHMLLRVDDEGIVIRELSDEGVSRGRLSEFCIGHFDKAMEEKLERLQAEMVPGYKIDDYETETGMVMREYYPDGALKLETEIVEGARHEFYKSYDSAGRISAELLLVKKPYYAVLKKYVGGKMRHQSYYNKDWQLTGSFTVYYPDGKVMFTRNYDEGFETGNETWFHANGTIRFLLENKRGTVKGNVKVFDENKKQLESWDADKWTEFRTFFEETNPYYGLE